ncbi:Zinc finger, CCHC-type [Corchorus capsularis]|uniref:Zinc finger, CCHC-type n=1 Tax=Corchorus capsularis TaxID=210143 RepID=A0A1R3G254_COCAP|nr:Zinc finger, CCHC-type [Corchorus capsularis]
MDTSWMQKQRWTQEYLNGVETFLNFAFDNESLEGKILCPCKNFRNDYWRLRDVVQEHLVCDGFEPGYENLIFQGESASHRANSSPYRPPSHQGNQLHPIREDNLDGMLRDAFNMHDQHFQPLSPQNDGFYDSPSGASNVGNPGEDGGHEEPTEETAKFYKLLDNMNEPLYEGSKCSKLAFSIRLFHLKCLCGMTGKCLDLLLEFLRDVFPFAAIPTSSYNSKKIIKDLGLGYEKIHGCPNDCMMYWGDNAKQESCHVCGNSRWEGSNTNKTFNEDDGEVEVKKKPAKVLRYFPLIPRLQRLFMSSKTAGDMTWHEDGRTKDGAIRHPADSLAWKAFDSRFPDFASDPRNVRLGLAADGFNPFKLMSTTYSTWPVVLMNYNLPPWIGMKQPAFILSMIIPGDKETCSKWLPNGKKFCYMGHRRWLDINHRFRFQIHVFDNTIERREPPSITSGFDILSMLKDVNFTYGKADGASRKKGTSNKSSQKRVRDVGDGECDVQNDTHGEDVVSEADLWKKMSILFELDYWQHNLLRHNLDVMHIEKNVCENIVATILNVDGKSKDNLNSRLDLVAMGIRHELHPQLLPNGKTRIPPACYGMSKDEKDVFCTVLKNIKVPDGYASNILRCVNAKERKLSSLKSHDYHILLHDLVPIALRSAMSSSTSKQVTQAIIELSNIFKELCGKVLKIDELDKLQDRAAITLCQLEKIFPPSFFTVMVHLLIHLPLEAKLGGPVYFRWMYPVERFLLKLGSYLRNKRYPEGSIAEGYLAEECLTFCSRYLEGIETRFSRLGRNVGVVENELHSNYLFQSGGQSKGKVEVVELDPRALVQAHQYVLFHHELMEPFRMVYKNYLRANARSRRPNPRELDKLFVETFHDWIVQRVRDEVNVIEDVGYLSRGPDPMVKRYSAFVINGFRFHTKSLEKRRRTQNSGVVATSSTISYASARDRNPLEGDVNYYGILNDIIELDYYDKFKVVLFRCDWADVNTSRGVKKDQFGFTLVNFSHLIHTGQQLMDEPYVFSSQVKQVFFSEDPMDTGWFVVLHNTPRDLYDMGEEASTDGERRTECFPSVNPSLIDDDDVQWAREDAGIEIAKLLRFGETVENSVSRAADGTSPVQDLDFSSLCSQLGPLATILSSHSKSFLLVSYTRIGMFQTLFVKLLLYVKSRNDKQLRSKAAEFDTTLSCEPEDKPSVGPIVPCGLIAWSLFNDTYGFSVKNKMLIRVGVIVTKLPSSWNGFRKKMLHDSKDYTLEELLKHLRIEEESRGRDKNVEPVYENNKANVVNRSSKPSSSKQNIGSSLGPNKDQTKFKKVKNGDCFVCGKSGHYARECRFKKVPKA